MCHDEIKAVFVGDLIDRGDEQLEVLNMVQSMVDAGSACIAMGNHELNAIGYGSKHPNQENQYLRQRNKKKSSTPSFP